MGQAVNEVKRSTTLRDGCHSACLDMLREGKMHGRRKKKRKRHMEIDGSQDENEEIHSQHQVMVDRLKNGGAIHTALIEEAFRAVPRHLFVPETTIQIAYTDTYIVTRERDGKAISSSSQPTIMAMMLEMLQLQPGQRVLEIGAGTGYNAALMAHIVGETGEVVTIDIDEDIVQDARAHLQEAGIKNMQAKCLDGSLGW